MLGEILEEDNLQLYSLSDLIKQITCGKTIKLILELMIAKHLFLIFLDYLKFIGLMNI